MKMLIDRHDKERVTEALQLLQDVAKDEGRQLRELTRDGFDELRSALNDDASAESEGESRGRLAALKHRGTRKVRVVAGRVDHYVHEEPWRVAGVAVACGIALGLLLDRTLRS